MIAIVNYGLGNVQAIANIYKRLRIPVSVASTPSELAAVDKIILPGVGAFDWAMRRLNESGMRDMLEEMVEVRGKAVLGICVGMQMLARRSDEGMLEGLGWINAEVKRFRHTDPSYILQLPHMGWNDVQPKQDKGLFQDLSTGARFYFLHSYYFVPDNQQDVLAVTDYHGAYASAVCSGNVFGVQFHPEKSHEWGVQLLKNFSEC